MVGIAYNITFLFKCILYSIEGDKYKTSIIYTHFSNRKLDSFQAALVQDPRSGLVLGRFRPGQRLLQHPHLVLVGPQIGARLEIIRRSSGRPTSEIEAHNREEPTFGG